ncbi:Gfo/Idh/MocA family protein [Emticicia agri]|nr:Gfo/Idh/MocA family oxidoreductase [Emticicia agri]
MSAELKNICMQGRRNFVKTMALGLPALNTLNFGFTATKPLGVALVGLGNYATLQLAPALQQTQLCKLTAIVTGTPEKAEKWSKEYNIPKKNIYNYSNFDEIRNNSDVDIIYVVLPNAMHAEYTIRAAQAGKHVICEKPMGMNVKECEDMIAGCKKANVKLSVGYRLYFDPYHLEMRRLGNEKVYGDIRLMESSLGFSMANPKVWRLNKAMGGGGAIMDLGVYCIQGARRTIGELPVEVSAQGFIMDKTIFKDIYEGFTFMMKFPSGAISNSTTTYSSYVDRLHATTGWQWFALNPSYNAIGTAGQFFDGEIKPMNFQSKDYQQINQLDNFARCIIDNKTSVASGEEGLIDLKIIEAIKQSADTGNKVTLKW